MTGAQLMATPVTATAPVAMDCFQNLANFGRFRVLKDKTYALQDPNMAGEVAAANVVSQGLVRAFKFTAKFKKGLEIHFNATNGGTIADIVDNSFHFVVNSNSTNLAATMSYVSRVCYKE